MRFCCEMCIRDSADTMQKNRNDLEKTIAGWGEVVAKAKETAKAEEAGAK